MKPLTFAQLWNGPLPVIVQAIMEGVTLGGIQPKRNSGEPTLDFAYHKTDDILVLVQYDPANPEVHLDRCQLYHFGTICEAVAHATSIAPSDLRDRFGHSHSIQPRDATWDGHSAPFNSGEGFMGFQTRG